VVEAAGLAIYVRTVPHSATPAQVDNDLGWILLAFAIFNFSMLLWATQVNMAVFLVFLTLQATEVILVIGNFSSNTDTIKIGGYVGIATAAVAWYASAAGSSTGSPADGSSRSARRSPADRGQPTESPAVARCPSIDHVTRAAEGPGATGDRSGITS
jgi:GPR1/FUN34/yaaH family protein